MPCASAWYNFGSRPWAGPIPVASLSPRRELRIHSKDQWRWSFTEPPLTALNPGVHSRHKENGWTLGVTWLRSSDSHGSRMVTNNSNVAVADGGTNGVRRVMDGVPWSFQCPIESASTSAEHAHSGSWLYVRGVEEEDGRYLLFPERRYTAYLLFSVRTYNDRPAMAIRKGLKTLRTERMIHTPNARINRPFWLLQRVLANFQNFHSVTDGRSWFTVCQRVRLLYDDGLPCNKHGSNSHPFGLVMSDNVTACRYKRQ
jgi:hypothetical protein